MANQDQAAEYPKIRYNLVLSRMEFFRAGIQWTAIPVQPGQIEPLEDNHVLLGNAENTGIPVQISGDGTLINTGELTVNNLHLPVFHLDDSVDLGSVPGFYWIDTGGQDDIHIGLPSALGLTGQIFHINAVQADFMDVHTTVVGQKIDGSSIPLDIHNQVGSFISDGTTWHTI